MVPGCLQGALLGSVADRVDDGLGEETLWVEVTSLERKPAIPPADGASLNLLAERCSRVRGGVLEKERRLLRIMQEIFLWIYNKLPCCLVASCCVETPDDGEAVRG